MASQANDCPVVQKEEPIMSPCDPHLPPSLSSGILMFVYGTLKRGQPNAHHMLDRETGLATLIGVGVTADKWPLVIASRYNVPYLLNVPGTGHNIVGEVWSVDQQKLDFLDEFETYPTYYDRLKIPVHLLPPPDDDGGQGRDEEHVTDLRLSDNEGVGKNMVWPMLYVMRAFKPELLSLPFHADYDSYGSHGLPYVESEASTSFED